MAVIWLLHKPFLFVFSQIRPWLVFAVFVDRVQVLGDVIVISRKEEQNCNDLTMVRITIFSDAKLCLHQEASSLCAPMLLNRGKFSPFHTFLLVAAPSQYCHIGY